MEWKVTKIKIRPDVEISITTPADLTVPELNKITQSLYHAVKRTIGGRRLYGDTR